MDDKQFLETWDIHNRINLYLLDAIEPASLRDSGQEDSVRNLGMGCQVKHALSASQRSGG